jgi:hypothetical protein
MPLKYFHVECVLKLHGISTKVSLFFVITNFIWNLLTWGFLDGAYSPQFFHLCIQQRD